MSDRLATLPWVEPNSIVTNGRTRQAKFAVKEKGQFNLNEVKKVLGKRYADGVRVLTGPKE